MGLLFQKHDIAKHLSDFLNFPPVASCHEILAIPSLLGLALSGLYFRKGVWC